MCEIGGPHASGLALSGGIPPGALHTCILTSEFFALADYRETAAKFQKEWHIQEPHRHFEFAPHVQSHALVSVINRGLIYHSLERQYAQRQVRFIIHAAACLAFSSKPSLYAREPHQSYRPFRPAYPVVATACIYISV